MIGDFDNEMLTELDRIVSKYGATQVAGLAELMRDPQLATRFADAMDSAVMHAPQRVGRADSRTKIGISKEPKLVPTEKHLNTERTFRRKRRTKLRATDRVGMGVLKKLRLNDPEKHSVIAEIRHHLISNNALRTMAQLRGFARQHNLRIGKASTRNAAIAPLLKSLSELPVPEIVSLRDSMLDYVVNDGQLGKLRDVIVKPVPNQRANDKHFR